MSYFTIDEVRQAAASASGTMLFQGHLGEQTLANAADKYFESQASASAIGKLTRFDIFLSHAYSDKAIVAGLFALLSASGFSVYVDWIHDRHRLDRNQVSAANAAILRARMQQCSSLFYATTQSHTASKWMPWECGYFDGYDSKSIGQEVQAGHVAILPILETVYSTYIGQEYLGLYPIARKGVYLHRNVDIHNQHGIPRHYRFDQWIANGHP